MKNALSSNTARPLIKQPANTNFYFPNFAFLKPMQLIPIYTARARASGGRIEGAIRTDDGAIEMRLRLPKEMGGTEKKPNEPAATNPEQLFACAWAASFADALGFAARQHRRVLHEIAVTAKIGFGQYEADGFGISAEFEIELPEISKTEAELLVAEARTVCPYIKAWRGGDLKIVIL